MMSSIVLPSSFLLRIFIVCFLLLLLLPNVFVAARGGRQRNLARIRSYKARKGERGKLAIRSSRGLRNAISKDNLEKHLQAFQSHATQSDDGGISRTSGTSGIDMSFQYIMEQLDTTTNLDYHVQNFTFERNSLESTPTELSMVTDGEEFVYEAFVDMMPILGVGGEVSGMLFEVQALGCNGTDFEGFISGRIALIQRGTCTFSTKVSLAEQVGAIGAIVYNPLSTLALGFGSYTDIYPAIPAIIVTFDVGTQFLANIQDATITFNPRTQYVPNLETYNLIAETKGGDPDHIIMIGAHLDSVPEGPGINDNGSGSAGILELALQLDKLLNQPKNKIRYAWWGGEEDGLQGSNYYVANLTDEALSQIAAYMNYDMIASPNYVRIVYAPIEDKDSFIADTYIQYFKATNLPIVPLTDRLADETLMSTDHTAFHFAGIPVGGLFTGAGSSFLFIKTAAQAEIFGGTANEYMDACYHEACDDINNINYEVYMQNMGAAAHALMELGNKDSSMPATLATSNRRLGLESAKKAWKGCMLADHIFDSSLCDIPIIYQ